MKRNALPFLEGFLFLIMAILACGPDAEQLPPEAPEPQVQPAFDLEIKVNYGRLRDRPSPDANMILQLEEGAGLFDLGAVSEHTTQIRFGSEIFDEPWLKVRTQAGQTGWVYAREVAPWGKKGPSSEFRHLKQLQSIFGTGGFNNLTRYQTAWGKAANSTQVAQLYKDGLQLRDTLSVLLEKKSYRYNGQELPDLFWIEDYIPGYTPQLVAEGSIYYLFNDYREWLQKAKASQGREDDQFFGLMLKCFPQDSIEYFSPAWELQTSDYVGNNLLGRGTAFGILSDINQLIGRSSPFSASLLALKDQFLIDITRPGIQFWEPDSLVIQEMDAIIQANWSIFTPNDKIALTTRRMQLDSATVHDIQFNARAGGN